MTESDPATKAAQVAQLQHDLDAAERTAARLRVRRGQAVRRAYDAGVDVADLADIMDVTIERVYTIMPRDRP